MNNSDLLENLSFSTIKMASYLSNMRRMAEHTQYAKYILPQLTENGERKQGNDKNKSKSEKEEDNNYQLPIKRIRYMNPHQYYVTADGHAFPTVSDMNVSPVNILNITGNVIKVKSDKKNGFTSFYFTPKFSASDVVPWKFVVEKLMNGYSAYSEVAQAFEGLMNERNDFLEKSPTGSSKLEIMQRELSPLGDLKFNNSLPQWAELRKLDSSSPFPLLCTISRIVLNKPMMALLGSDAADGLHHGVKNPFNAITVEDSLDLLLKSFTNYRQNFIEGHKNPGVEKIFCLRQMKNAAGETIWVEVKNHYEMYSDYIVNYYTFYIQNLGVPSQRQTQQEKKQAETKTIRKPNLKLCCSAEGHLKSNLEQGFEFCQRFDKSKLGLFLEPAPELVCRIKHLPTNNIQEAVKMDNIH